MRCPAPPHGSVEVYYRFGLGGAKLFQVRFVEVLVRNTWLKPENIEKRYMDYNNVSSMVRRVGSDQSVLVNPRVPNWYCPGPRLGSGRYLKGHVWHVNRGFHGQRHNLEFAYPARSLPRRGVTVVCMVSTGRNSRTSCHTAGGQPCR